MGKKNQPKTEENGDIDATEDVEGGSSNKEQSKKSKKTKKKKEVEDNVVKELEEMKLEDENKDDKVNSKDNKEKKSKKTSEVTAVSTDKGDSDSDDGFKPTVGGGFAALMMNDDDGDNDDDDKMDEGKVSKKEKVKKVETEKSVRQENGENKEKQEAKKERGKKKAKRKGKDDDDEDDIDQLLAELESEYTGVKKEPKQEKDVTGSNEEEGKETIETEKSKEANVSLKDKDPKESSSETTKAKEKKKAKKESTAAKKEDTGSNQETQLDKKESASDTKESKLGKKESTSGMKRDTSEKEESTTVKGRDISLEAKQTDKKKKNKSSESAERKKEKQEDSVSDTVKTKNKKGKETKKDEKKESTPEVDEGSKKKKGQSREDKKKEEDDAKTRKGPTKKMLAAMKEMLEKKKEEEERRRKEEEERERQEIERIRLLEEQRRLEEERKERQRQKQKDRMKRLKEEGKLLTAKQKLEQKRAQAMLEHLKAQGIAIPEAGEKIAPLSYKKNKKKKLEEAPTAEEDVNDTEVQEEEAEEEDEKMEVAEEEEIEEDDGVADTWDAMESESEEESSVHDNGIKVNKDESTTVEANEVKQRSSEDEESDNEEHQTEAQKRRERARNRMEQRRIENEKNRSDQILRAPVVCVLGHVDHGKTKILDKLRRTNVQEGEVGGITQQIGATNVPFDAVRSQTRMVKDFDADSIRLPGLLIIDTPGHESFSNLRSRGSSLCDIAILVVDITQGLEPQTIESINLLKNKKTPFVVALNKVDRVFEWDSHPTKDIREVIKLQNEPCKNDFDRRTKEVIQALNIQGLNAALFWENPDPRSYVSLIPTSAISGDGMGNLMALITTVCQKRLTSRLMFSDELQCTVLEVKTIQGHGTTIDVILINGSLREGDSILLAGTEGPIVTQIRSLLIPKPMKEIRVKGQYDELKVVKAALGVKIAARELEKAIAGLNLQVAYHEDEIDILKEEVDREFKTAMRSIKVRDKGVYVQASTLGALEALLEFFKANKVPYSGIRVGPVVKRDVMKAAAMLEHDPMYAVILAFDVKVERDAQELADKEGVRIFSEETIYHLGDRYVEYIKEYKKKKQDEFRLVAVFPSKLKIIPTAIFNKRDPIVLGVTVEAGILRTGTPMCVPSKEFVELGVVTSLEFDHKPVELAKKGVSVCMKIEPFPGQTPKLFGRHFDVEDVLVSKITRESIDACKQYFRDDLGKTEWKLMAELKKQFGIL